MKESDAWQKIICREASVKATKTKHAHNRWTPVLASKNNTVICTMGMSSEGDGNGD